MVHTHRFGFITLLLGFIIGHTQAFAQLDSLRPLSKTITLVGGIALPTGALAATSGNNAGYGKMGFLLGAEFATEIQRHFLFGLEANFNSLPMDEAQIQSQFRNIFGTNNLTIEAGTWTLINALASVGFNADISPETHFYGKGKLGVVFGSSPTLTATVNGIVVTQNSASATALAFGFGVGVIVNNSFDIGIHYVSSEPEYSTTTQGGGSSINSKFSQPTSVVQFRIGYAISLL